MKLFFAVLSFFSIALARGAVVFTNSPDADAFVRAAVPSSNYGAAGMLSVSGPNGTNSAGVTNGAFDSFIRFNAGAMVTNFNSTFGSNNWTVTGATLNVTETFGTMNAIFNQGVGAFAIRWVANTNWTEGTGMPNAPGTSGIMYGQEPSLLNNATDVRLGVFTNSGLNAAMSFPLALPPAFVNSLLAGGDVGFYLTAIDPGTGFTFNSRNFATATARPFLTVSAAPQPGIAAISVTQTNLVIAATNGAAGGTYSLLTSISLALPLNQWTVIATNVLTGNGNFVITVTNAMNTNVGQFFVFRTQ